MVDIPQIIHQNLGMITMSRNIKHADMYRHVKMEFLDMSILVVFKHMK
jgi:hypothetical protein